MHCIISANKLEEMHQWGICFCPLQLHQQQQCGWVSLSLSKKFPQSTCWIACCGWCCRSCWLLNSLGVCSTHCQSNLETDGKLPVTTVKWTKISIGHGHEMWLFWTAFQSSMWKHANSIDAPVMRIPPCNIKKLKQHNCVFNVVNCFDINYNKMQAQTQNSQWSYVDSVMAHHRK